MGELGRGRAGALSLLLIAGCSLPSVAQGPAADQPCAFLDGDAVSAALGSDVVLKQEIGEPEHLCRFLDPSSQEQLGMLSVQDVTSEAETADLVARIAQTYGDDAVVTEVRLDGGVLGPTDSTAFNYCGNAGCYTSLAVGVPPYFLIVHVAQGVGDVDEAVAIAEQTLAVLSP